MTKREFARLAAKLKRENPDAVGGAARAALQARSEGVSLPEFIRSLPEDLFREKAKAIFLVAVLVGGQGVREALQERLQVTTKGKLQEWAVQQCREDPGFHRWIKNIVPFHRP